MNFLDRFNKKKNIRFNSFKETFRICKKRGLKIIVETGTARGKIKFLFFKKYNWKDGMSTIMFAEYVKNVNGKLHTCDISAKNIDNAKKFTKNYSNYISYYVQNSIDFLRNFNDRIDLLYLDSLDGHDPIAASDHQLREIKIGINKLHLNSLILLDDKGSKTNSSINFLLENGYEIIFETEHQVLLSK